MIIGIGGISQSGKSYLSNKVSAELSNSTVLSLDDYTLPEYKLPKIKDRYDWELPKAYDFNSLLSDALSCSDKFQHVILEGILIFYDAAINRLFDKRIMLMLEKSEFLKRRRKEKRWGDEPEWFLEHVWYSYEQYGKIVNDEALLVNAQDFADQSKIMDYLRKL
ncbi:hypothetical protein FNH22_12420 [Fulvivirga sp. M361]|uniref:hypothetical protein n=1 Tax=Fulvivirga sp. M361 TaxID=2594266 RepID=UPI001179CE78|nr:hypothetical protein [Fulvivirga sp. M361]TRX58677.1 hypothetical protein FNH22_12420 [Fulvivirga sp. M361]